MFCLHTWFGLTSFLERSSKQDRLLPCHAKLGGNFVGYLQVCQETFNLHNINGVHQGLCDLQAQASKLMPHACRNFEDVILTFKLQSHQQDQQACLTPSGFAYKDSLTQEEAEQACRVINTAERVDIAWDDNDEHATNVVQASHHLRFEGNQAYIYFGEAPAITREVAAYLKMRRLYSLTCCNNQALGTSAIAVDLAFLKHIPALPKLVLREVVPTDWDSCVYIQDMCIWHLNHIDIPCGIGRLVNLRILRTSGVDRLPADFGDLDLRVFSFGGSHTLELRDLIPHLEKMPNLETFRLRYNYKQNNTTIPTEIGNLVSLTKLEMYSNHFVGSIPSELGRLTRLSRLALHDHADFDLTCPQEVLALNIPNLDISRPGLLG
jgi:hypothetical protein